jgi:hypothetical protein
MLRTLSVTLAVVLLSIPAAAQDRITIQIPSLDDVLQGHEIEVPITIEYADIPLQGFDLLVAYDPAVLYFISAQQGWSAEDSCGWEYFTFRYIEPVDCPDCPDRLIRLVGWADISPMPNNPGCQAPAANPTTLATLTFLVSNDRNMECSFLPISFFWITCDDNTLVPTQSNCDHEIYLSRQVMDHLGRPITAQGPLPAYTGASPECDRDDYDVCTSRPVEFLNGGVQVVCAEFIDAIGDINLNNIAYEIADAVMFSNYFVDGVSAFGDNVEGSIDASDVNRDGEVLGVADFVYLVRVIVGDALPDDSRVRTPVRIYFKVGENGRSLGSNWELGALRLVLEGDCQPRLMADYVDLKYVFDGEVTRVFIYSISPYRYFGGADFFVWDGGRLLEIEAASARGNPVDERIAGWERPGDPIFVEPRPNPFNSATIISFETKQALPVNLTIYDILGRKVFSIPVYAGHIGFHSVYWDGTDDHGRFLASGIYFCRIQLGEHTHTQKLVLFRGRNE